MVQNILQKKDWIKIKKDISKWGTKDLWGDFDLLIGAYKNNLKITKSQSLIIGEKGRQHKDDIFNFKCI